MIHREGRPFLIVVYVIAVLAVGITYTLLPALVSGLVALIAFVICGFFTQFFRNPKRNTPLNEDMLYSPADGKVVVVERVFEKRYFNKEMTQVSVFMSPFNVHVNRAPFAGKTLHSQYHEGKFLVAFHPKSSELNESTTMVFESKKGVQVMCRQIAGAVARRIVCYVKAGDAVAAGDEIGFIKFGSRMDIFLPLDADVKVKLGDKTTGGETLIADLSNVRIS